MVKFDKENGAGWWIFKLPKKDPYQIGAYEHDQDAERKARGLPTNNSRPVGNDELVRTWQLHLERDILRPGQDAFARVYEAVRQKVFRAFIWAFQVPLRAWRPGRITYCPLAERGECICLKDRDSYGNTP